MQVRIVELKWLSLCNCVTFVILTLVGAGVLDGSKAAGYESPSHERLVYLTTCLIGHNVEVQLEDGSLYSGIFHAANADKHFGMSWKFKIK